MASASSSLSYQDYAFSDDEREPVIYSRLGSLSSSSRPPPPSNIPKSPEEIEALHKKWDSYARVDQPADLTITLFPHQRVTVHNMEELERLRKIKKDDTTVFLSDFGILGDIPGYGKSFSVVSLILRDRMPWDIKKSNERADIVTYNSCLKVLSRVRKTRVRANLLVVSPTLVEQWKEYFGFVKPGVLQIKEVTHAKDIENIDPDQWDVILCSSSRYNELVGHVGNHVVWKRFIFDEAGSTHITGMRTVHAGFVWFVTATYDQLMRCVGNGQHYMKNFFANINYDILPYFVIRNEAEFVRHSFKMPDVHHIRHVCLNPRVLNVLSNFIDYETRLMIGAGDIRGAISRLGGGLTSESNLFEIVTKRQKEKLAQAKFSFEFWTNRANAREMEHWDKKVKEIEKTITELEEKYKNVLSEDCTICYSTISDPVLLPCCQNIFCGGCIMKWFETTKTCPMCRSIVPIKEIVYIKSGKSSGDEKEEKKEDVKTPLSKPKTVMEILSGNENKKFLIFSMFDESFSIIRRELEEHKMDYVEISGSKATRDAKLKRFKEGRVNIVFLNSRFNGAGINLEMATDIILYHEMPSSIEEQVIGRALRIGRKGDVTVHHLVF
jgi:SNF2 family DNA or RNA helicase